MKNLKNLLKKINNKTLLVVFPHPDDESFNCGGLLSAAKRCGFETHLLILTKGGAGRNYLKRSEKTEKETKRVRENEMTKAGKILEIDNLTIWDFQDGQLRETEKEWAGKLAAYLKELLPGIVVTYDPSGITGHPDHIVVSLKVLEVLEKIKKQKRPLLFWPVPGEIQKRFLKRKSKTLDLLPEADFEIGLGLIMLRWRKLRAVLSHQSQLTKTGRLKLAALFLGQTGEFYHRVDFRRKYPHRFVEFEI